MFSVRSDYRGETAQLYAFGLTIAAMREDIPVYVEYKIKNLPELFKVEKSIKG